MQCAYRKMCIRDSLVEYGYNIPAVSQKVQDKVKSAIENMTGLEVTDVNVRIAGVNVQSKSL